MKKFFISTAIDYVNAAPHLGHALEKVQADVIARYHRNLGDKVFFLSGTDENSLKNVRAADRQGLKVEQLVNRNSNKFYQLKEALNLSLDDFIRTTEPRHVKGVQKLWKACHQDIYKKNYKGLYCVDCEQFYEPRELINGCCPEHRTKPELVEEKNYFFKLSNYQNQLKKIIEQDQVRVIPQTRKNEVLSFINEGLTDICISRSAQRAQGWGIEVPDDPSQIVWVWFDALSNYINALGYLKNSNQFRQWWQQNDNKVHVIGKGILRFHAIYWPAILLSAGLELPQKIFVHGYITANGEKMSKSLGNVIDPFELVEDYGTDAVRYFLLREISPTKDGDFTYNKFEQRYNADLASGVGNLVARVLTLAENKKLNKCTLKDLKPKVKSAQQEYRQAMKEFKFSQALASVWNLITACDQYIEQQRPWELEGKKENQILNNLLFGLANIASLLKPFLPQTSDDIWDRLGTKKLLSKKLSGAGGRPKQFLGPFYGPKELAQPWQFKVQEKEESLFPRL